MKKVFTVPRVPSARDLTDEQVLALPAIAINEYRWMDNGCTPRASARIWYGPDGLGIYLEAREEDLRATFLNPNDPVCRDSCMEFFFSPNPETDPRYMNVEANPFGTMYIGLGTDRHDSRPLPYGTSARFDMRASVTPENLSAYPGQWALRYTLPRAFLEEAFGTPVELVPGKRMRANFYKCGDETPRPHYGSWNPIDWPHPDFHRPEFFGELILGD